MADLLRIRAYRQNGDVSWEFVDNELQGCTVELDSEPTFAVEVKDGDIWQVELIGTRKKARSQKKVATVRPVAKVQSVKPWRSIKEVPGFWIDPDDLFVILSTIHRGFGVVLVGPKGTGKTQFGYYLAECLGWQEPCKVDVYTIKRTTDLFGSDAAREGSTLFNRSVLFEYIERARVAEKHETDDEFVIILDEINRVHSKANESMHGLFDETRQVSVTTTEGTKIIKMPKNIHFIGTMNEGSNYEGIYGVDDALKSRFQRVNFGRMPEDRAVERLVRDTGILESQGTAIVQVAYALCGAAESGTLDYAPDYREALRTAGFVADGMHLRRAVIYGLLAWYEGELDSNGEPTNPNSMKAKAFAALRMKRVASQGAGKGAVSEIFRGGAA